ncbi:MAG: hypothetical protein COC23_07245 [Hyphomicrobiales bacterium]|nr:MAG: hypothetical protein COC23_07245 [Hyphomicrobiales bacterium]
MQTNPTLIGNFIRGFRDHPQSVGETYFQHLFFAAKFSGRLFAIAGAAFVHAIIPSLFETTASKHIIALSEQIKTRNSEA